MPSLTYSCPGCGRSAQRELLAHADVACPDCSAPVQVPAQAEWSQAIRRCFVCHSGELFVRKDFPQRLGVTMVVVGFAASCVTWYLHQVVATFAILFATALIDMALFLLMGNVLECYRCHAQYRDVPGIDEHQGFDLEIHERYRQQAARLSGQNTTPTTEDATSDSPAG